jgi:cytochrome b561
VANDTVGRTRYSSGAIILHWAIAILILFNLFTGFFHHAVPKTVFGFHVSSGITILALTVVRILWRLTHKPPPFLPMAPWERGLAHVVHFTLYLAMLAAPLTGWAMVSAHVDKPPPAAVVADAAPQPGPPPKPRQMMIWGVIPLPKLAPITRIADQPNGDAKIKEAHELFEARHETIGWIYIGLLLLHIAGALKHQFIDRRRQLARMGVGKSPAEWDTRT